MVREEANQAEEGAEVRLLENIYMLSLLFSWAGMLETWTSCWAYKIDVLYFLHNWYIIPQFIKLMGGGRKDDGSAF